MLGHFENLSIKQGLKTQYFVIFKKYTEKITIALLLQGKRLRVVENRIEQYCAAHIVQCCQQYCLALLHPIAGWIQA